MSYLKRNISQMFDLERKLSPLKYNLATALNIAINALEQDIFKYDWNVPDTCNCGVVVSAMTEDGESAWEYFRNARIQLGHKKSKMLSWKEICQDSCNVTGKPMTEVFEKLFEFGLQPKDIVHLEYMSNPAILQESGINTDQALYYQDKNNLVLYLKAWVRILNKKDQRIIYTKRQNLEADLLIATAFEKYEDAIEIKKELATL